MAYPATMPVRLFKQGEFAVINGKKYVPERTCHVEGSYYDELMDEDYTDLSCGHHLRGAERDFDFCYRCGARIVLCYNS